MSGTSSQDRPLSRAKLDLLVRKLRARSAEQAAPEIRLLKRDSDRFPLSFAQQRLWVVDQLQPASAAYNLAGSVDLRGPLDVGALERALGEIVRRHEVLRTTFVADGGQPLQVIGRPPARVLSQVDIEGLPAAVRNAAVDRLTASAARRPFDLARGPLLRAALLRRSAREHLLLVTLHHIVADDWSLKVLLRELATLYAALAAGEPSPLPELPAQYVDFALWQRQRLTGEVLERQRVYWHRQLADAPLLELPSDRPRPAVPRFAGAQLGVALPAELAEGLRQLARSQGATLFMALLAVFNVLLSRHAGRQDVVIGSPIANRNRRELEGLIGFFVNMLVLRTDLSPGAEHRAPSFREVLRRVREVTLEADSHQELPFEKLVEELMPERSSSHNPFFEVALALQGEEEALLFPGLEATVRPLDTGTSKFDLSLVLTPGEEGLQGSPGGGQMRGYLEYDLELFDAATMARWARQLAVLAANAVADPSCSVARLPVLAAAERHELVIEWNDTARSGDVDRRVHQLFAARATAQPEALAVADGPAQLSYGELNRRANRLAHRLRSLGVGPEVPVGVCCGRSTAQVLAILAVVKAGGAYLPLDPAYPPARRAFILEDAGASLLITLRGLAGRRFEEICRVLTVDGEQEPAATSAAAPAVPTSVSQLAYVIYTSGSTGRPKGVGVTHGALSNLVSWHCASYRVRAADRSTLLAGPAFDASVWELWPYLISGACLCIPPPELAASPADLGRWLASEAVTLSFLPTPLAEAVLEEGTLGQTSLRALLTGGDRLHRVPDAELSCALVNHYGPTETTVVTTWATVSPDLPSGVPPPIGRPIDNHRSYVLSRQGELLPMGAIGELCVGGAGVGRGYGQRPDLTAARFTPDPFAGEPGARLYRTGDRTRVRPDGTLEFVGRLDDQVQIRGYRIEPGEVEATLIRCPEVREAVVVAWEGEGSGRELQLVAYAVPSSAAAGELSPRLRRFLAEQLPETMMPSAIVLLESLPLTPHGKVDRRALPAPSEISRERAGPRTAVEEIVAGIWADLLGGEPPGIDDDFFERGGHSLLATRMVSRLRDVFGYELAVRAFFEAPTIAGLAAHLEQRRRRGAAPEVPAIASQARASEPAVPLSFAQERLWFLDQFEPGGAAYNIPAAVRLRGELQPAVLAAGLNAIVQRHEALRTAFDSIGGRPVQVISPRFTLALPTVDLSRAEARLDPARRLARAEARRPFDLQTGPLLRATLLRLGHDDHVVLLTLHHIIADGWSMEVLIRELTVLYETFTAVRPPARSPLPELPVQYADFALWQRKWLSGELLERQTAFWRRQLAGIATLELPTDRPRPAVRGRRGATVAAALPEPLSAALGQLARRRGVTLFMTLLAGFATLLWRCAGKREVTLGTPIANRTRVKIEGLIGFFVNTLVLRIAVSPDAQDRTPSFRELLARVREVTLDAYAHQDVPFEKLVEELQPQRDPSTTPLFQVMFALQNAPAREIELPGLTVEPWTVDTGTAKFDLNLTLGESAGGVRGTLEYSTELFDATTVARLLGHFRVVLSAAASRPDERLSALPLLTAGERQQLTVEWNGTESDFPAASCLHQLVEAQVERAPQAIAVSGHGPQLTYRELERRASDLAGELRRHGVGPEVRVALLCERTPLLVVAVLGVLKAGGAFLPLDPSHPRRHLAFILEDAEIEVVLSQASLAERLPGAPRTVVLLDQPTEQERPAPAPRVGPDNPAYVIYTSGSTGRPKGVRITHRAAVNFLTSMGRQPGLEPSDTLLAVTTLAFDISVLELFLPLIRGARVEVADRSALRDGVRLGERIRSSRATVVQATPATWQLLLESGWQPARELRILCGGESLTRPLATRLEQRGAAVWNLYGPTETTVWSALHRVRGAAGPVPIGRPIANTRIYLLDRDLQPLPSGVAGELFIGGSGLARGYLKRPALTAERFIPDPLGPEPGACLYRTGDLARYLADGGIEFLGRLDHQVKIRGFRIELGEIEAVLSEHSAIREVVVAARRDPTGDSRLVAYVVPERRDRDRDPEEPAASGLESPDSSVFRAELRERLPEYMVPSLFVELAALPLTPSGKVDRRSLPVPRLGRRAAGEFAAPRTPLEEMVADIWSEVLDRTPIGIRDDFFELGGHSLLATQMISRVRSALMVEVPLPKFFERPTVAALAQILEAALRAGEKLAAPPLERRSRDADPALSFAQQRLWFLHQLDPQNPAYHIPCEVRITGPLEPAALRLSFDELVRRHEVLRTTFTVRDGGPVEVIRGPAPVTLPLVDCTGVPGVQSALVTESARREACRPFSLEHGPLLRLALLRLEAGEHVLLITLHHIISDAWSMQVLIREIGTLYNAIVDGEPPALPRLPIQYADFACWQRRWLRGEVLDDHLAYWRRRPALRSPAGVARHSVGGACPSRTGDRRGHVAGVVADRAGIGAGVVYVDDLAAGLWASRARRVCPGGVGVAVVGGRDRCVAARSSPVGGGAAGYRAARRVAVAAKQPRILRGDGSGAADRAGDPVGLWWRCRSVDFRHHG